jgi:hypothetical protein
MKFILGLVCSLTQGGTAYAGGYSSECLFPPRANTGNLMQDIIDAQNACYQRLEAKEQQQKRIDGLQNQLSHQRWQIQQYQQQQRDAQQNQWLQQTQPRQYLDPQTGQIYILKPLMQPLPPQ